MVLLSPAAHQGQLAACLTVWGRLRPDTASTEPPLQHWEADQSAFASSPQRTADTNAHHFSFPDCLQVAKGEPIVVVESDKAGTHLSLRQCAFVGSFERDNSWIVI